MEPIILYPHQEKVFEDLVKHYTSYPYSLNTSVMGSGKTFLTYKLYQYYNFKHMIVVCPAPDVWETVAQEYQIPNVTVITFTKLRGVTGRRLNHNLLSRLDETNLSGFKPSSVLYKMIDEGCLLVVDESHATKNESLQFEAVRTLCRAITVDTPKIISRILFLTASPFDKPEQPVRFLQCVGVIRNESLFTFNKEQQRYYIEGLKELITYCNSFDKAYTQILHNQYTNDNTFYNNKNIPQLGYVLYQNIINPRINFSMPKPKMEVDLDCKNGFYKMLPTETKDYVDAIHSLHGALKPEREGGVIAGNLGAIVLALRKKEYAKLGIYVRQAIWTLENIPNSKVVISVNYNKTVNGLMYNLKKYNPLLFSGTVTPLKRKEVKMLFQEHNLNHRLLITNINISALSVSFDDSNGNFPRYAFGESGYKIMNDHQWTHRFYRLSTKSVPHVRFVYGNVINVETGQSMGILEQSIMSSIQRKSLIMKETLQQQVADGVKFPSDYELDTHNEIVNKDVVIIHLQELIDADINRVQQELEALFI